MAQSIPGAVNATTTSGAAFVALFNAFISAYATMQSGTGRPANAQFGLPYLRTNTNPPVVYVAGAATDGSQDIPLFELKDLTQSDMQLVDENGVIRFVTPALFAAALPLATDEARGLFTKATAAEIRSKATGEKALTMERLFAAAAKVTIADQATIPVDFDTFINAIVEPLGDDRTLGTPSNTNKCVGQSGFITFRASGATRALALGSGWYPNDGIEFPRSIETTDELTIYYVVEATGVTKITGIWEGTIPA